MSAIVMIYTQPGSEPSKCFKKKGQQRFTRTLSECVTKLMSMAPFVDDDVELERPAIMWIPGDFRDSWQHDWIIYVVSPLIVPQFIGTPQAGSAIQYSSYNVARTVLELCRANLPDWVSVRVFASPAIGAAIVSWKPEDEAEPEPTMTDVVPD